ncbi:MAG: septum formation protein Maf [Gammaproteobacteria bacterium]|nr:septum formation protein Maf [Gammaproteobacteria bacterium]|tara:strand:- start:3218 stop:3811 length:594 start_codon:yes stop_codon:yes gene_type:complete
MTQNSRKIILGSSSIYRERLLSKHISYFELISPEIDESAYDNESPQNLSMRLAITKARKIAEIRPENIVIGADQVVSFENINIGKQADYESAYQTLISFSGKNIDFYTSAVIIIKEKKIELTHLDKTTIKFKKFSKKELEKYLKSQDLFDSTAAVKFESKEFQLLVDQTITEDEEAIIGLPMIWLLKQLKKLEPKRI